MDTGLKALLTRGALELGVGLSDAQQAAFDAYLGELTVWNRKMNLTAIEGEKSIVIKHFLDSLTPVRLLSGSSTLLDIGAGGGFPGIPLKIALPDLSVTLLDAVEKKVHFMRHAIRRLGLKGAEAVSGRAESEALVSRYAGSFDCVISRAFAEVGMFLSLAMPYVRQGGLILAMKGPGAREELATGSLPQGLSMPEVHDIKVPGSDRVTTILSFKRL